MEIKENYNSSVESAFDRYIKELKTVYGREVWYYDGLFKRIWIN